MRLYIQPSISENVSVFNICFINQKLKVLHVVPTFYPATYWGGPIYSVFGLSNSLAKIPAVVLRVLTTDAAGPRQAQSVEIKSYPMQYPAGYDVYFCRRKWLGDISPKLLLQLWPMIRWADVVHLTAVYSSPTIPTLLICNLLGKPVVWSPRGALLRWEGATRRLEKNIWEWVCNMLIRRNKCVMHVTSTEEASASETRIRASDYVLIPNGVEIPETIPFRTWKPEGVLRLLVIGRIHPIKGIENLLRAIKILEDEKVYLSICGVGSDSYVLDLRKLVNQLGLDRCVQFQGQVEGKDKVNAFLQADVCVVASHSENFCMVVAEALAHGVPVIASKGTPWSDLESRECGIWVENTPEVLAISLRAIARMNLAEMGMRGRDWMQSSFGWLDVASRMHHLYQTLLDDRQSD